MTIQIKATGIVLNPRCPLPKNPQYPPRTYFDFQTETHGKLSFNMQHDHLEQLQGLGFRPISMVATLRASEWQGNQRLEVLKLQFDEVPQPQPAKP